jgi:hypothetical protein
MSFIDLIYRMLIYKIRLKYNTVFIIYILEFKTKFAFIIISPYYNYFIRYFLFDYINNFYKNKEYIVYTFSL